MLMKRSALIVVAALLLSVFIANGNASGQTAPAANDVSAALIRELHDLRLAIEKLANSSSRVQVLAARASQREQHISSLTTDLIGVTGKLSEAAAETSLASARLEQLKERLRTETDPKRRAEMEEEQAGFTIDVTRRGLMQSSIQAQVNALRQQILAEQSDLADIEHRLDELDRPAPDSQR
jgi:chromosome segregation ATPase